MIRFIVALALLVGCAKPEPKSDHQAPAPTFDKHADRLKQFYDGDGFVVSRTKIDGKSIKEGEAKEQGDSAFFTSLAVYALDCVRGQAPADALAKMLTSTGGAIYRHPSMPTQVSLDPAIALYRAIAKRSFVCGDADKWAPIVKMHIAYIDEHNGLLNAGDVATLPLSFRYLLDRLAWKLGVSGEPSGIEAGKLQAEAAGWAVADVAGKAACYRIHLALNTFQTLEALDVAISAAARGPFCAVTDGTDLPTTDHWCGRGNLQGWIDTFQDDLWQYRHQRCPSHETPDSKGDYQPAVDLLVAWADAHGPTK